jgi:hypothetical protein
MGQSPGAGKESGWIAGSQPCQVARYPGCFFGCFWGRLLESMFHFLRESGLSLFFQILGSPSSLVWD